MSGVRRAPRARELSNARSSGALLGRRMQYALSSDPTQETHPRLRLLCHNNRVAATRFTGGANFGTPIGVPKFMYYMKQAY